MKSVLTQLVFLYTIFAILIVPVHMTLAEESYTFGAITKAPIFRFNNDNWFIAPHPKVISFTVHDDGSATGMTETGVTFIQYNVPNTAGIRVQRFEIEDHYHYIIDGEIVYSFEELSARLALAYFDVTNRSAI